MTALSNTAAGGTHGVSVATDNTAGPDPWSVATLTGGTWTYSNLHPADDGMGYEVVRPTNSTFGMEARWDFTDDTEFYGRAYFYFTSGTWPSTLRLLFVASSTGGRRAEINLNSTGNLRVLSTTGATVATSTSALPQNTLIRVEYHFLGQATTGRMEASYYLGHSTTPVQTLLSGTNVDTAGAAGRAMVGGSGSTITDGYTFYFDAVKIDEAAVGPALGATVIAPVRDYPSSTFGPF